MKLLVILSNQKAMKSNNLHEGFNLQVFSLEDSTKIFYLFF